MSIYSCLFDWQKKIVDQFKHRSTYGLFLTMGLGKTPISLAFAEQNFCEKVLVITINSKAVEDENVDGSFLYWAKKSNIDYHLHVKSNNSNFSSRDIFITNYESLFSRSKGRDKKLELKPFINDFINSCKNKNVALIIDESHKIKNIQSQQTLAIFRIQRDLMFRASNVYTYLLTGTPFTTGYIDVYSQLKLLGYSETKGSFIDQFCVRGNVPGLLGWQQPIIGYKNVDALFKLIHKYAITMESETVVKLPEQIFNYHSMKMSQDFLMFIKDSATGQEIVNTFKRHKLTTFDSIYQDEPHKKFNNPFFRDIGYLIDDWSADTAGTTWLRARQLSIGFQGNAEKSYWFDERRLNQLKTFLEQNEDNYVLFYNYTPELLKLYDICEQLGYNIDVYCGEIKSLTFYNTYLNSSASERLVNHKNIILANFASGSTGMNWQAYHSCIIFSLPLYKDYAQGIARIHRLGQTETTVYHVFMQDNFLDSAMKNALQTQQDYSSNMFDADLARIQSILNEEST